MTGIDEEKTVVVNKGPFVGLDGVIESCGCVTVLLLLFCSAQLLEIINAIGRWFH